MYPSGGGHGALNQSPLGILILWTTGNGVCAGLMSSFSKFETSHFIPWRKVGGWKSTTRKGRGTVV